MLRKIPTTTKNFLQIEAMTVFLKLLNTLAILLEFQDGVTYDHVFNKVFFYGYYPVGYVFINGCHFLMMTAGGSHLNLTPFPRWRHLWPNVQQSFAIFSKWPPCLACAYKRAPFFQDDGKRTGGRTIRLNLAPFSRWCHLCPRVQYSIF